MQGAVRAVAGLRGGLVRCGWRSMSSLHAVDADHGLSEEQVMLKDMAEAFAEREL